MLYYFESDFGCGIRDFKSISQAREKILAEVGTHSGVKVCRPATNKDISWVKGMGGFVPEKSNPSSGEVRG